MWDKDLQYCIISVFTGSILKSQWLMKLKCIYTTIVILSKILLLKEKSLSSYWQRKSEIVFSPSINCFQIYSPPEQVSSSNTHEWTKAEQLCACLWFGIRSSLCFSLSLFPQIPQVFPLIHEVTVTCKTVHPFSEYWSDDLLYWQGTKQMESTNFERKRHTLRISPSKFTFFSPCVGASTITLVPFL